MIQDIAPHSFDNMYRVDAVPSYGDYVLFVCGQEVAVRYEASGEEGHGLAVLPRVGTDVDVDDTGLMSDLTYLFSLDGNAVWLAPESGRAVPPAGFKLIHNRVLRMEKRCSKEMMFVIYTAVHLGEWYASHRYCGSCGARTAHHKTLRALVCPSCGATVFPRLNPAVIVCVRDPERDKIVLTRYAKGRYVPIDALVAGFVEIGETIEECVKREVREELGIEVKNITYYKSQPWGVASDILSGYWCDVDGDPTLHMDATELGRAEWVGPEEIAGQPDDLSLTNEMMCVWRDSHLRR